MKNIARVFRSVLVLVAAAIFFAATQDANAQVAGEQKVTVVVQPAQTVEQRVADSVKEKELLKAAEEKKAAEESARLARMNPKALLADARTVYISSDTSFFDSVQLRNALLKRTEVEAWQLMFIDGGWDKVNVADLVIEVDRPLFTYTFTYQITHRPTGIIVATGKVTAFDGNAAAPKLAKRIVEEMKKARGEATGKK